MITTTKEIKIDARDFAKLSQDEKDAITLDVVTIAQSADVALNAPENLHGAFKNPNINQHLKRIRESTEAVKALIKRDPRYNFKTKDTEYRTITSTELYVFMNLIAHFGLDGLTAINENLRIQLKNPQGVVAAYKLVNDLTADPMALSGILIRFAHNVLNQAANRVSANQAPSVNLRNMITTTAYNQQLQECLKELGVEDGEAN